MAWKEITGGNTIDIKKKEKGSQFIGEYKGRKQITTQIGNQFIYEFVSDEGIPFGIFGFTVLNFKMEAVPIESHVRITYQGTINKKTKFGMKDVHQVTVEINQENGKDPIFSGDQEVPF